MERTLDRILDNIEEAYLDDFDDAFANGNMDSANEALGWMAKDLKDAHSEMKRFEKRLLQLERLAKEATNDLRRM